MANNYQTKQGLHEPTSKRAGTDSNDKVQSGAWPSFLVMVGTSETNPLSRVSPFALQKGIEGIAGVPRSAKRLFNGSVLIEVAKRSHADNLLKASEIARCPISVYPHKSLNISKGVVRCRDLASTPEAEILSEMADIGVISVHKIKIRKNNELINSGTVILTFNNPRLPPYIEVFYQRYRVDPYIPSPLRCFKCQKFGHRRDFCKSSTAVCSVCSEAGHDDRECANTPKCVNCAGDHGSASKLCPQWLKEKEIQTIRVIDNISFFDAKKKYEMANPVRKTPSYAAVTTKKPIMISIETQTQLSGVPRSMSPRIDRDKSTSGAPANPITVDMSMDTSAPGSSQPSTSDTSVTSVLKNVTADMILEELSKREKKKEANKSATQSKHKRADQYKNKSKEDQLKEKKRLDSERRQSSRRADVQNSNRISKGDSEPVTTQNRFDMFDGVAEEDAQKKDSGGQKSNIIKLPT